jgi:hypothetical protein
VLPPLYARWMDGLLGGAVPAESKATCDSCAMLPPKDARVARGELFYSPITKCCTFLPELANFLVGGILNDDDPALSAGRQTIERRIDAGLNVTPLGLGRSAKYSVLYNQGRRAFGQAKSMECPHHLADGRCGVWRHRESTCATWFCKHERGAVGQRFWGRLHDLLGQIEKQLSVWCLLEQGIEAPVLERLFAGRRATAASNASGLDADELEGTCDPGSYRAAWGAWAGREREIYRRSAELVAALDWNDVLAIGGVELRLQAHITQAAHDTLRSTEVPDRLRPGELRVLMGSAERTQLVTYSEIDPLSAPRELVNVLHHFDGRPTEEVVREIAAVHDLRLRPGLVRKLVDFDVLRIVNAEPAQGPQQRQGRET